MLADVVTELLDDLAAEHDALDAIVRNLSDAEWDVLTPGGAWRVRDQIGHLAFFDQQGTSAARDPAAFESARDEALTDPAAFSARAEQLGVEYTGLLLLAAWRTARGGVLNRLAAPAAGTPAARVPWYGPPMSLRSFATARLMETWAHGQDVADALGAVRAPTMRLRHIAHIGVRTRGFSYAARNRPAPDGDVPVELDAPDGSTWTWGSEGAPDRVTGPALDFCLVVTQRRHPADTALKTDGALAEEWLAIAQA